MVPVRPCPSVQKGVCMISFTEFWTIIVLFVLVAVVIFIYTTPED